MSELKYSLKRIIDHWNQIPIRVKQDGKWQSLYLSEIKEEKQIVEWIYGVMKQKIK